MNHRPDFGAKCREVEVMRSELDSVMLGRMFRLHETLSPPFSSVKSVISVVKERNRIYTTDSTDNTNESQKSQKG
jgi:hypothetical protein